jgi:transcriptional regulator with XRE-family HTH domain
MNEPFGVWLKERRKEAEMSQRDLAALLKINHTYLSKIEAGKMPPPGEETLQGIASVLSIAQDDVYRKAGRVPRCIAQCFENGMSDEVYRLFLQAYGAAYSEDQTYRRQCFNSWQEAQQKPEGATQ